MFPGIRTAFSSKVLYQQIIKFFQCLSNCSRVSQIVQDFLVSGCCKKIRFGVPLQALSANKLDEALGNFMTKSYKTRERSSRILFQTLPFAVWIVNWNQVSGTVPVNNLFLNLNWNQVSVLFSRGVQLRERREPRERESSKDCLHGLPLGFFHPTCLFFFECLNTSFIIPYCRYLGSKHNRSEKGKQKTFKQ